MSEGLPSKVLVFGASGHIGGPAAHQIAARRPDGKLRLATGRAEQVGLLQAQHPSADVRLANYLDADSIRAAFDGIEAAFVVTPDFLDETAAMGNVVAAAERSDSLIRLVRLIGDPPGLREEGEVQSKLKGYDAGTDRPTYTPHINIRHPETLPVVF